VDDHERRKWAVAFRYGEITCRSHVAFEVMHILALEVSAVADDGRGMDR
jgi:hypothetical protein